MIKKLNKDTLIVIELKRFKLYHKGKIIIFYDYGLKHLKLISFSPQETLPPKSLFTIIYSNMGDEKALYLNILFVFSLPFKWKIKSPKKSGPKSYSKGYPIYYDGRKWLYMDNMGDIKKENRACKQCDRFAGAQGTDACIGYIPGVQNACCGHGVQKHAYISFNDGTIMRGHDAMNLINIIRAYRSLLSSAGIEYKFSE